MSKVSSQFIFMEKEEKFDILKKRDAKTFNRH